jgi:hypothetical protein
VRSVQLDSRRAAAAWNHHLSFDRVQASIQRPPSSPSFFFSMPRLFCIGNDIGHCIFSTLVSTAHVARPWYGAARRQSLMQHFRGHPGPLHRCWINFKDVGSTLIIPCGSFPLPSVPSSRYSTLEHHASMLSFFGEASGPSTDATFALALGCKETDEQYSTSSCRDCPNITKVHHLCNVQAVEARRASHTRISLLGTEYDGFQTRVPNQRYRVPIIL